jgi:outer membrane protein OmpA-like peptidoglycan-associated protein
MRIELSCARAARSGAERAARLTLLALALAAAAALVACNQTGAPPTTAAAPAPKTAQPFNVAIDALTDALIAKVDVAPGTRRAVVIDPLIEKSTGFQTTATHSIGAAMENRIRARWPQLEFRPFNTASLDQQPLILLGSIAGVTAAGSVQPSTGKPSVYRIWAVVADLKSDKVIDRQMAWVKADEIDQTPMAFFSDSPAWTPDPVAAAYIKTCSSTAGTPIDPAYRKSLQAEAMIADAIADYDQGRYQSAQALYRQALATPSGEQLRALNGVYLTDWALGRHAAAEQDFGRVVDYGLSQNQLGIKFLFRPGSTAFWPDPAINKPYPMWIRQIARRADAAGSCLALTGHTSVTGTPAVNDPLSLARAQTIRARMIADRSDLRGRTVASGAGAREPIVGTGTDDATDALDRRVEIKPAPAGSCAT